MGKREKYPDLYKILDGSEAEARRVEATEWDEDEYITVWFTKDSQGKDLVYVRTVSPDNKIASGDAQSIQPFPMPESALRGTHEQMSGTGDKIKTSTGIYEPKAISMPYYKHLYLKHINDTISDFKEILKNLK